MCLPIDTVGQFTDGAEHAFEPHDASSQTVHVWAYLGREAVSKIFEKLGVSLHHCDRCARLVVHGLHQTVAEGVEMVPLDHLVSRVGDEEDRPGRLAATIAELCTVNRRYRTEPSVRWVAMTRSITSSP